VHTRALTNQFITDATDAKQRPAYRSLTASDSTQLPIQHTGYSIGYRVQCQILTACNSACHAEPIFSLTQRKTRVRKTEKRCLTHVARTKGKKGEVQTT
jgi:hypothetical protein